MKLSFSSKSKDVSAKFAADLLANRSLASEIKEENGAFNVEYSIADIAMTEKEGCEEEDDSCSKEDLSNAVSYVMRELQYQTNWMSSYIESLSNQLYKHINNGHLPAIQGADKMQKALEALGISGDYEVAKPVVYASRASAFDMDLTA